ncbi:hypothetical protein Ndes2437B_g06187 [Nannochloris sp. 'desiccata']
MESVLVARISAMKPLQLGNAADKCGNHLRISRQIYRISTRNYVLTSRQSTPRAAMQSQSREEVQASLRLSNTAFVGASSETTNSSNYSSAPLELMQRLLAASESTPTPRTWAIIGMLAGVTLLATPGLALAEHLPSAASSIPQPIADLAENEDFWANVLRYISYFFSVLLGTAYVAIKPIFELLKRPTTAILVIIGGAALYFFVSTTVGAMLGMNDIIEYEPSSIVTPMQQ